MSHRLRFFRGARGEVRAEASGRLRLLALLLDSDIGADAALGQEILAHCQEAAASQGAWRTTLNSLSLDLRDGRVELRSLFEESARPLVLEPPYLFEIVKEWLAFLAQPELLAAFPGNKAAEAVAQSRKKEGKEAVGKKKR